MSFLSRLLGTEPDPREKLRPLWHQVIKWARDPAYFAEYGVEDSVPGRFDMITAVLAVVMVRLEASDLRAESALIAELFVEDMDGQVRELGINDVVVGKHVGKLMGSLGGRLGAYRPALNENDREKLSEAVARNVTMTEESSPDGVAKNLLALAGELAAMSDDDLLAAKASA